MGETMTYETTEDIAIEDHLTEIDVSNMETADDKGGVEEPWDTELFALVCVNQEERVRCPWMDDAEVTLGDAMLAYPRTMTAVDEPFLISIVNEMLASRVIQTDEPEKENKKDEEALAEPEDKKRPQEEGAAPTKEPAQKTKTKTKVREPQIKSKTADSPPLLEKTDTPQNLKVSIGREEKPPKRPKETTEAVVEVIADSADKSVQRTKYSVASEAVIHLSKSRVNTTNTSSPAATEALPVTHRTFETLEERPVVGDEAEIGTGRQPEALKITRAETTAFSVIEEQPASIESQLISDQTPEPLTWLPATKESKPIAPINGIVEASGAKPTLVIPEYQIHPSGLSDFDDEDVLISHFEEVGIPILETIEYNADIKRTPAPQTDGELHVTGQEVVDPEQQVQADLVPDEIENSLIQLAEHIKVSDPPVAEMANEHLDKIIEIVANLDVSGRDNTVTEAKVQEELEELFTELFDLVDIDYTPELINDLVRHTLTWHLVEEIEKLKDSEEIEEVPQDSGAHVIIKKLIAALKTIQSTMTHACAIGKAALVLCSFNFQLKLNESF